MQETKAARQPLPDLIDSLPLAIFETDLEGRLTFANKVAFDWFGYSRSDLEAGQNVINMVAEQDRARITANVRRLMTLGTVEPTEYLCQRKDKTTMPVHAVSTPILKDGRIAGIRGFLMDLSPQRKAEAALRTSEERFKRIFEESRLGIALVNGEFKFVEVNPALCDLLGYTPEELTGRRVSEITHPDHLQQDMENSRKLLTGEIKYYRTEKRYLAKDNRVIWANLTASLIRTPEGKPLYCIAVIEDISGRKRTEEERLQMQTQLQQAQKLEALGVLAGGIAHDFNNLLAGLFGFVELALNRVKKGDFRRVESDLSKAMSVFDRSRDLTQQLLTFSKGGIPDRRTGLLAPVIRNCAQFALSGSNAVADVLVPVDLWPAEFDENQISQVLDNILINAQQAMPGGGKIQVTAENTILPRDNALSMPPGNYIRISVRDSGAGIPEQVMPFIFDPFFTTKKKGSGLGLSISYSIVKKHGGHIRAESGPGGGCVFHVLLPAVPGATPERGVRPDFLHHGSGSVLVMDDEEFVREMAGGMLQDMGYEAVKAVDGREALEQITRARSSGRPFKAVILDLTVPGGSGGLEVIADIRKNDPMLPVIASSGYFDDPVMANPAASGFSASLGKPYRADQLSEVLQRVL